MKFTLLLFAVMVGLLGRVPCARAEDVVAPTMIRTETVEYADGDTILEGYLAFDENASGKRPGILIVHEWRGVGQYVKSRAEQLARLGYVAFAADIYGKGVRPGSNEEAAQQAGIYRSDRTLMRRRALAGLTLLRDNPRVDGARLAAIGYCFGGTVVLELARSGADVKGVVSFHGGLGTPNIADAKDIRARVLVLHGADDPHVPPEEVARFQEEMKSAGVDWQMVSYGGAVHSFTNREAGADPAGGSAYNRLADERSWKAMRQFFREIFKE